MSKVLQIWKVSRATFYRQRKVSYSLRKRGPKGPCSDSELSDRIRDELKNSDFHSEGYRKMWAKLRFHGTRTSKRRVLRVMRDNSLLVPVRIKRKHGPKAHDGNITTETVDMIWGTDITTTYTRQDGAVSVFIAVDHCAGECIGIHCAKSANRFEALEPIRQGVRLYFGQYVKNAAVGLKIRHDHGTQYMSEKFQEEIEFLGAESSPAFVREPQGNGFAEWFVRTLKENLLWTKTFDNTEELRLALLDFREKYNRSWMCEKFGYKSPYAVRAEKTKVLEQAA